MTTERPVLRAIIAKPIYGGKGDIGRTRIVPLSTAFLAHQAGWYVCGPDPEDEAALAEWQRGQREAQPFNGLLNQIRRVR